MLYPAIDPSEWAKLYSIDDAPKPCLKCGGLQKFVTPFAHNRFRGLISSHESCGPEFRQSVFTFADRESREELGEFVKDFKDPGPSGEGAGR